MIVTIDGPAGAGKSTLAKALARQLGFDYLDTGAMYRAVTWACLRQSVDLQNAELVTETARRVQLRFDGPRVFVDDIEATQDIRTIEITRESRFIANNPEVRAHMVAVQQQLASGRDIVCEGRDQGTVAFPKAECKIFLTASREERARRRLEEMHARGELISFEEVLSQQDGRDRRDETREVGPLRPADDAVIVDTTGVSADDVLSKLVALVNQRKPRQGSH